MGTADPGGDVGFRVYLGWRKTPRGEPCVGRVGPRSASYRQYLSPAQFRQQFAPSQSQVGAVRGLAQEPGLHRRYTPQNNHYVSAEGTVAQAAAAFGTTFNDYTVQGLALRSPASEVTIPSRCRGS